MISAKIIEHSINQFGNELITIQTKAPKFLDAEIEKHRMISSNSSSDRAIPFNKIADRPKFIPSDVRLDERGMQGYTLASPAQLNWFQTSVEDVFDNIILQLSPHTKIHKQHINRYLIAFTYQDKVMTANRDQWDYFLSLRNAHDADPAIQDLSRCVKAAIDGSVAVLPNDNPIHPGIPYHLPYITVLDVIEYDKGNLALIDLIKISCARCARVSYLTHDNKNTKLENDLALYDMLLSSRHITPMEHVAISETNHEHETRNQAYNFLLQSNMPEAFAKQVLYTGNFRGWVQHRKLVEATFG